MDRLDHHKDSTQTLLILFILVFRLFRKLGNVVRELDMNEQKVRKR